MTTLRIDLISELIRGPEGELVLRYDGKNYARRDLLPLDIFENETRHGPPMAVDYVASQMVNEFGTTGLGLMRPSSLFFPLSTPKALADRPTTLPSRRREMPKY